MINYSQEDETVFEHEIKTAPPGSDRKANYEIAAALIEALDRLTAATLGVTEDQQMDAVPEADLAIHEVEFPRINTGRTFEPEPGSP